MFEERSVSVIIPTLNEEQAIGSVVRSIPNWVDEIVVVDNGSTDATARLAAESGARVVLEPRRGYGQACLAGVAAVTNPDIVVFLDGDGSDDPGQMERLVAPVARREADLIIGSRTIGRAEHGSITIQQRLGTALACFLMRLLWGARFTDLGPFRAIRADGLQRLAMADRSYGWTIQMQIRAVKAKLRWKEVPVNYRRRIGRSKISGTLRGVVGAGAKILYTVAKERLMKGPVAAAVAPNHLVVFTRFPTPGATKTRLIPTLGADRAAEIAHGMTARTLAMCEKLAALGGCTLEVRTTGAEPAAFREHFGRSYPCRDQGAGDLGRRLHAAAADAFAGGARKTLLIGTDCPDLEPSHILDAFVRLNTEDIVVGPADDGGYYLIGVRRMFPNLFVGIHWGAGNVLDQTRERAASLGASMDFLPTLRDVDRPEDVPVWDRRLRLDAAGRPSVSVIIPALNEEETVVSAIRSASAKRVRVEVILVDSGSTDRTVALARECGAKIVHAGRGRAVQMNAGAACASGEFLVFLHADSTLPPDFAEQTVLALSDGDTALAAFRLSIDSPRKSLKWIARLANARSRHGLPYGDQAFAVRADLFLRLGGYRDLPIMEDFALARALRRHGAIKILDSSVTTSARRWMRHGVFATTLMNQLCVMGFLLGIAPTRLARFRESLSRRCPEARRGPEPRAVLE